MGEKVTTGWGEWIFDNAFFGVMFLLYLWLWGWLFGCYTDQEIILIVTTALCVRNFGLAPKRTTSRESAGKR